MTEALDLSSAAERNVTLGSCFAGFCRRLFQNNHLDRFSEKGGNPENSWTQFWTQAHQWRK
jgi:hypothetical protein